MNIGEGKHCCLGVLTVCLVKASPPWLVDSYVCWMPMRLNGVHDRAGMLPSQVRHPSRGGDHCVSVDTQQQVLTLSSTSQQC